MMDLNSVQVVPHPDDVASENAREQQAREQQLQLNRGGTTVLPTQHYSRHLASSPFPGGRSGGPTPQSASGYFNSDFENENISPCNLADFPDPDGGSEGGSNPAPAPTNNNNNRVAQPSAFRPPPPVPAPNSNVRDGAYNRFLSNTTRQEYRSTDVAATHNAYYAANQAAPTNMSMSHNESYDNLSMPETFWEGPVGVEHVNWLMSYCQIVRREEPITSLKQCTSSLFVLVFQRIFNCNIEGLELDPNTHEKRLHNIQRVLEELEANILSASGDHVSLSHISAEQIVLVNEEHIAMLVQVFLDIAQAIMRHSQMVPGGAISVTSQKGPSYTVNHAAGTGAELPLRQQLLEDIASEVSAADSADKTQQLVSRWQQELVHPVSQKPKGISHSRTTAKSLAVPLEDEIANLRRRMLHFDEHLVVPTNKGSGRMVSGLEGSRVSTPHHGKPYSLDSHSSSEGPRRPSARRHADPNTKAASSGWGTVSRIPGGTISKAATGRSSSRAISANKKSGRSPRRQVVLSTVPYVPASTYANFPAETYHMVRTLDRDARDYRIEQLRTMRFVQDTCAEVRADIVKKASEKQASIAAANKEYAGRRARDIRDIKKLVRDEDNRYKEAYQCIMLSARNDINRFGDVVDRHSRHVYKKNEAAIAEAQRAAEEARNEQENYISAKVKGYSKVVTGWRAGTIAAA